VVSRLTHARIINSQLFNQPFGGCLVHLLFGLLAGVPLLLGLRGKISLSFRALKCCPVAFQRTTSLVRLFSA
jgi:hypothetical protein